MKVLLRASVLAMLGVFAANEVTQAQISEPGPYYSQPSWDQQLPASTRFIVLTNWGSAAVLDRETGLVWQQNPCGSCNHPGNAQPWATAIIVCDSVSTGGRFGWRLPSVEEFSTLFDPSTNAVFSGTPFTLPSSPMQFWTASTDPTLTTNALSMTVSTTPSLSSPVGSSEKQFTGQPFWCVRGYQGTQNPQ